MSGGTVALAPWSSGQPGYILADNLRIRVNGTVITSQVPGQFARLVARSDLRRMMIRMDEGDTARQFELSWLIIDGNKHNRLGWYAADCAAQYRDRGISVSVKGAATIRQNVFENAMCGSALEVSGTGFAVYSNTIQNSGFSEGTIGAPQPFADGITVMECINSSVTGNFVINATDVGIVVGLDNATVNGCNVSGNTVTNDSAFAFAGITNGGAQARVNTTVANNTITAGLNKLAFGMFIGEGPWGAKPPTPNVGTVRDNFISGAVVNMGIDQISGGSIFGNVLYGARGSAGMLGCTWPAELTYGSVGSASIQPGGIYRTWQGTCSPYGNPPPSAQVTGPSEGATFTSNQSLTITASASDPEGGGISEVRFYAGSTYLGTDNSAPFSWAVNGPLPVGTFDLTAVAYDAGGRGPTSNTRRIHVVQAPSVTITNPVNGAQLAVGSSLTLTSTTTGGISFVDYWAAPTGTASWFYLGRGTGAPYSVVLGPLPYGDFQIGGAGNGNTAIASPLVYVTVR